MNATAQWARATIEAGTRLSRRDDGTVRVDHPERLPADLRKLFTSAPDLVDRVHDDLERNRVVEPDDRASREASPHVAYKLLLPLGHRCWYATTPQAKRAIVSEATRAGEAVLDLRELFQIVPDRVTLVLLERRRFEATSTPQRQVRVESPKRKIQTEGEKLK